MPQASRAYKRSTVTVLLAAMFAVTVNLVAVRAAGADESLEVVLPAALGKDACGRLLLFAELPNGAQNPEAVDASYLIPAAVEVAGQDVRSFGPEHRVTIDLDREVTPKRFSELPPGEYQIQAVLDPDGDYARYGRDAGDIVSKVTVVRLPLHAGSLVALDHVVPHTDPWNPAGASPEERERLSAARPQLTDFEIDSPTLSSYFGRRVTIQAWVLVPKRYVSSGSTTWPVVYFLGVGGSNYAQNLELAGLVAQMTSAPEVPQMMWVFLNYSTKRERRSSSIV